MEHGPYLVLQDDLARHLAGLQPILAGHALHDLPQPLPDDRVARVLALLLSRKDSHS
jgi:hypothetical protein